MFWYLDQHTAGSWRLKSADFFTFNVKSYVNLSKKKFFEESQIRGMFFVNNIKRAFIYHFFFMKKCYLPLNYAPI